MVSYQYCSCLYYHEIHPGRYICRYFRLTNYDYVILFIFISNCHGTFVLSQISNMFIYTIFGQNNFAADKETWHLWFSILNKKCRYQFTAITQRNHWNTEQYSGSDDRCEGDLDSNLNRLDSGHLWHEILYPVSVSNCLGPDHGIFCILIIDLILRSALVVFSLLRACNYHDNKGTFCNLMLLYSHYRYGELSIFLLFILSQDASA